MEGEMQSLLCSVQGDIRLPLPQGFVWENFQTKGSKSAWGTTWADIYGGKRNDEKWWVQHFLPFDATTQNHPTCVQGLCVTLSWNDWCLKGKQTRRPTMKFWINTWKGCAKFGKKSKAPHISHQTFCLGILRTIDLVWKCTESFNKHPWSETHLVRICFPKSSQASTFHETGSNRKDAKD